MLASGDQIFAIGPEEGKIAFSPLPSGGEDPIRGNSFGNGRPGTERGRAAEFSGA